MNKYFYSLLTLFFVTFSYAETTSSISGDVNKELKDLNDTQGFFEPDGDLDD